MGLEDELDFKLKTRGSKRDGRMDETEGGRDDEARGVEAGQGKKGGESDEKETRRDNNCVPAARGWESREAAARDTF